MAHPVSLSKSKLLSFIQCPRRLWLEQYSPELEEISPELEDRFNTGELVGAAARRVFGRNGAVQIDSARGLRSAIEQTAEEILSGEDTPIFEASFDYDGLVVQIDVLDRSEARPRIVEVKASSRIKDIHIADCAIQVWTLERLGHKPRSVCVARINPEFEYAGDGDYGDLFAEEDVTARVEERLSNIPDIVDGAREVLRSLDEPAASIGEHCTSAYTCPFFDHCSPPQGAYPVESLGGPKRKIFQWLNDGHEDLRDIPEDELSSDTQRLIWNATRRGEAFIGSGLEVFTKSLDFPRFFLDFETIAFAVPIWPDTRPYEALPYQWSCHVADGPWDDDRRLDHKEFLDISGEPPMRVCAERLIEALGTDGPIFVYSHYERSVIDRLAQRFDDLAPALRSIADRLVDLYPVVKQNYYHPDMRGSWSIKALLPTIAPDLDYAGMGTVRDGQAAGRAFVEAISTQTSHERRAALHDNLLAYCRLDSLAIAALLRFLERAAI